MKTRLTAVAMAVVAAMFEVATAAPPVQAQQAVNVLTGGGSGVYYPLGVALAKIYSDIPDTRVQVQTTDGSVENLLKLQQGGGQIGFASGDSLKGAWEGDAEAEFRTRLGKLRVVAALYPSYIQILTITGSGIATLADLKGRSLSVGAPKSGTELNARAILSAAGLSYQDLGKVAYLSFADSIAAMKARQLDATLQSAGLGVTSLSELTNANDTTVVAVPGAVVDKVGPPFFAAAIPANTYAGQSKEVPTAAVMNYLVTSVDVPDDLVYRMTRLLFESLPKLANAHPTGRDIKLETAAQRSPIPLHPGAVRFYREKGLIK